MPTHLLPVFRPRRLDATSAQPSRMLSVNPRISRCSLSLTARTLNRTPTPHTMINGQCLLRLLQQNLGHSPQTQRLRLAAFPRRIAANNLQWPLALRIAFGRLVI
jgi:hypothetical protein